MPFLLGLTKTDKEQVLDVARQLICEELRNWFELIAEIVRERLKNLDHRRTNFHTYNVSLICSCQCGALAGHLEGITDDYENHVAPEEDPAMARVADYLLLCPPVSDKNAGVDNPYCVKILNLLKKLSRPSKTNGVSFANDIHVSNANLSNANDTVMRNNGHAMPSTMILAANHTCNASDHGKSASQGGINGARIKKK